MRTVIVLMVALSMLQTGVPGLAQEPEDLRTGIRQVEGGDFDAALITLDAAARRLAAEGKQPKALARAYVYLAIAYLELGQEEAARTKMMEALRTDKDLRLDEREFPPKVIRFFGQVRGESALANPSPAPPSPVPTPAARPSPSAAPAAPAKGHSKTVPIVLGVVGAAAAVGAVAAASGRNNPPPSPPPTAPPVASLSSLSATVTSPQRNSNLSCTDNVGVTVTLTNRAATAVAVTGVRHDNRVVAGGCGAANSFTFSPAVTTVGANQTATVLNTTLFSSGSGCCVGRCTGGFCQFGAALTVVTSVGQVPAGEFGYGVTFQGCATCPSSTANGQCSDTVRRP